jgi:hypothetical protein
MKKSKRIIRCTDVPNFRRKGLPPNSDLDKEIKQINLNPEFDKTKKHWTLIKVLNSTTRNVPWFISFNGQYYIALQYYSTEKGGHLVAFYKSDESGIFPTTVTLKNLVLELLSYVDIEGACDQFVIEQYLQKLN